MNNERQQNGEREERDEHDHAARLAAIVDSSNDAIIGKTLDGVILSWNAAAERIFGYAATEMIGQPIFRVIPPELHEQERAILARLARGERVAHYETERVRKDGQRILVSLTLSPVVDRAGRIAGVSSIKRDITEQRRLEERLLQVQKMEAIGRLAAGIAHDFNNILTAIVGYCTFLLRRLDPGDSRFQDALGIRQAADRAMTVTQQLLAFSRKQVFQPELLDLDRIVADTGAMLARLIGEHVELQLGFADESVQVVADPGQMMQVLLNLAVNARDAMPRGGILGIQVETVDVTAEQVASHFGVAPGAYARLTVSDTGEGMDAATRSRIFEPFFTTKRPGEGTGLGLATVFGIVTQSGGQVFVESEVGGGSRFIVYLPRVSGPSIVEDPAPPAGGGRETVLVVEDDPDVRALTTRVLREYGYAVIVAGDPESALALAAARREPVDLLIADVVMPRMSGPDLAERLTARWPSLSVLHMSGFSDDAILHEGVVEPGGAFIQKPFTPDGLARRVREVLDHRGVS